MKPGPKALPRVLVTCETCGKKIRKTQSAVAASSTKRFFCDVECRRKSSTRPAHHVVQNCVRCGIEFNSKPSAQRKYCSETCFRADAAPPEQTIVCSMCKKKFVGQGRRANNTFCSRVCADKRAKGGANVGVERSKHVSSPCATCGTTVRRRKTDMRKTVFCDRICYGRGRTLHLVGTEGFSVVVGGTEYWANRTSQGYVTVYVYQRGNIPMHRLVMSTEIGRDLVRGETVHHKNGVRDDNNLSNLELWSSSHPSGQRVEDKIAWARDLLDLYGYDTTEREDAILPILEAAK